VTKIEISTITLEKLQAIIDQFKQQLKAENKSILYNTFNDATFESTTPGSLHITSTNSLSNSNIAEEKDKLQELILKETGHLFRITNSFVESNDEPLEKALSKTEIFEQMAIKNPTLLALKDALRLGIER
jgi:hypothetical protein